MPPRLSNNMNNSNGKKFSNKAFYVSKTLLLTNE